MLPFVFRVVLACLVFFTSSAAQEQCQPFNPSTAVASKDVCPPFLSKQIWVPSALPSVQIAVDSAFHQYILSSLLAIQPITPIKCFRYMTSIACNNAYPPCDNEFVSEVNTTVSLPVPLCRSYCDLANMICAPVWQAFQIAPIDCYQISPFTGLELFSDTFRQTYVNGTLVNTSCLPEVPLAKMAVPSVCPFPLIHVINPTEIQPPCAISCPDPSWSPHQWQVLGKAMDICAIISFSLMLFLSFLYVTNPDYRTSTKRISLHTFISQMMFALSIMIGGSDPAHNVWCVNEVEFATVKHPACGIQAILFISFGLSTAFWMATSAIIWYLRLNVVLFRVTGSKELICCAIAYGLPIILWLIPVKLQWVKAHWRAPLCFIEGYINDSDVAYHILFFYLPLAIALLVMELFVAITLARLLMHKKSLNKSFKTIYLHDGGREMDRLIYRLIFWLVAVIGVFSVLLIYRIQLGGGSTLRAWIWCRIRGQIGIGPDDTCPTNQIPQTVSFPFTLAHYIMVSSIGIFSFLASGTDRNLYYFWWDVFTHMRKNDWGQAWMMLTVDKKKRKKSTSSRNAGSGKRSCVLSSPSLSSLPTPITDSPSPSFPPSSPPSSFSSPSPLTPPVPPKPSSEVSFDDSSTTRDVTDIVDLENAELDYVELDNLEAESDNYEYQHK